jgi:hypothetical protein
MTSQHEKRKSKRVSALKPTYIYLKGNTIQVHDISNEGIGIVLADGAPSFAVGERLPEIPIPLASGTVTIRGVVSHVSYTTAGKMCGIQFLFEGTEYQAVIDFIHERLQNPAEKED